MTVANSRGKHSAAPKDYVIWTFLPCINLAALMGGHFLRCLMANSGFLCPRPSKCPECIGGTVGMDSCETCKGTGTVFKANGKTFPDTKDGYDAASKELGEPSDG